MTAGNAIIPAVRAAGRRQSPKRLRRACATAAHRLGYQLPSLVAGGPSPHIATALFAAYQSGYAMAIHIALCAVVSLISAAMMPDYTGKDISAEYDT